MRVTVTNGTRSVTDEITGSRTWRIPASGTAGSAELQIRRGSLLSDATYLDPNGGSVVTIHDQDGCGVWTGVILPFEYDGTITAVSAFQVSKLLGQRIIQRATTLRNLTAGAVVTVILRESLAGVRGISMTNAPYEGGVLDVRDIDLDGQDAWSALSEMMDRSDGEVHITATGDVNWCGPLAYASRYDTLLVAGSSFRDARVSVSHEGRVSSVTAVSGNQRYTASRADMAAQGWPAQAVVSTDESGAALVAAAATMLTKHSEPMISVSGAVTSDHYAIRERNYVQVLIPWVLSGNGSGVTYRCRVLARTLGDDRPEMPLELQVMQPTASLATTTGAGARQPPPARPSGTSGGSIAQQFRAMRREVARLGRST